MSANFWMINHYIPGSEPSFHHYSRYIQPSFQPIFQPWFLFSTNFQNTNFHFFFQPSFQPMFSTNVQSTGFSTNYFFSANCFISTNFSTHFSSPVFSSTAVDGPRAVPSVRKCCTSPRYQRWAARRQAVAVPNAVVQTWGAMMVEGGVKVGLRLG